MSDIQHEVLVRHPSWKVYVSQSGAAKWLDIVVPSSRRFTIQVTPSDGVGVSEIIDDEGLDFGGHDEVFNDLSRAISYVESLIDS